MEGENLIFPFAETSTLRVFHYISRCSVTLNQQTKSGNRFHIFRLCGANDLNYGTVGLLCVLCPSQTMEKISEHSWFEKSTTSTVKITPRWETNRMGETDQTQEAISVAWLW